MLIYDWQGGEFARRLGGARATSREQVGELIDGGHRIICYQAEEGEHPEHVRTEGFEWFCDMSFQVAGVTPGRKLFVADECHHLIGPRYIPHGLSEILSRGGRREMDTVLIGAAANGIHNEGRNQISELYCFRCVDERALDFPTSLGLEKEEIQGLPDTHFLYKDLRTGQKQRLALWDKKSREPKGQ